MRPVSLVIGVRALPDTLVRLQLAEWAVPTRDESI